MLEKLASREHTPYNFTTPLGSEDALVHDALFSDLVNTKAFQRLKDIRFLGGIDYLLIPSPNGELGNIRYTRYQHSLGVAKLAGICTELMGVTLADCRLAYTAALLHDIGHAPFSHSLESVFATEFGLDHHKATRDIITGRVALGEEVYETLRDYHIDVERIIALIEGNDNSFLGFFSGPINFDTIEGILRSRVYGQSDAKILGPEEITRAAVLRITDNDRCAVDDFWSFKNLVYRQLISSKMGALADYACKHFMIRNLKDISADDYFITEQEMFEKLPGLKKTLLSPSIENKISTLIDGSIIYKVRHFYIDQSVSFFSRDDRKRYLQSNDTCTLSFEDAYQPTSGKVSRELFDEKCD